MERWGIGLSRLTKRDFENDFCLECRDYGEPNGCNRSTGTCEAYDFCQEAWDKLAEYEDAEEQGLLLRLPVAVGDSYTGICAEVAHGKKGWKMVRWLDSGKIEKIEIIASLTAEKAGYNNSRNLDELGKFWFIGENSKSEAEKALERKGLK